MKIKISTLFTIFFVGVISTILFLLMLQVLVAQMAIDFIIGNISNNLILFGIILTLLILNIIISIIVGFIVRKIQKSILIQKSTIIKASIMSICLLLLILYLTYIPVYLYDRNIFSNIQDIEIILVLPQVLIYFGVFVLNGIFNLYIFTTIAYFLLFVVFLNSFQIKKIGGNYYENR